MAFSPYLELEQSEFGFQIPKSWKAERIKFCVTYNDDSLPENTEPDKEISYVDISSVDLVKGITRVDKMSFGKAPSRARRIVRNGDTIVSTVRTYLKAIASIDDPVDDLVVSTGFAVLRPMEKVYSGYLSYFFQSQNFVDAVGANSTGVSYPAINPSVLVCLPCAFPAKREEQTQITRFLDYKITKINHLVEKKKALIEKLNEQRVTVITQAVTKGLNPDVSMKDSEVAWLGEVPKHWEVKRLKFAVVFQRGHDLPASEREEGGIPLVSSAGISSSHSVSKAVAPGIVTGRYGTIGKFTYVDEDYWPLNTTLYSVDTVGNDVRFLWYMLHNLADLFLMNSKKSAVPGIDRNDLHSELTAIPPLEEQKAIVEHLNLRLEKIDGMITLNQQTIEKLEEYRTALITAAVTGKIDVRNVEIPDQDAA